MSKKLFELWSPAGKLVRAKDMDRKTDYFSSKSSAKKVRDKMNLSYFTPKVESEGEELKTHIAKCLERGEGYTVSYGPDHWRYTEN
jgi:hypothetical protein